MSTKVDEVLMPETKEVYVGKEKFEVGPLVRAKYGKLINVFAELVLNLDQEVLENAEEHIDELITIISDQALLKLYAAALDKNEEWVNNNLLLPQEIKLFSVILEVNDIESIIENFTKVLRKKAVIQKITGKLQSSK
ncbi:hypothetical protein SAMN04515654_12118 [Halanaerobium congolense]|uniref:Uncharacterized protein n=1 Tax=Halanaerobium congolense TaxID=54121 RepID=A0A1G8PUK3_9FIRM|nr:hypothetical protein [Halanaerobium congolense]SDI95550.1 hypothetical protein SAMN04515654_12118 [Halanaerobium congolense]SES90230.1 hypothetical protein SAMN04515653_10418 [Halanaerobium congolense]